MTEQQERKKILLCDENALHRKLIVAMLTGLPYTVMEAVSGREALALALAEHGPIDLVLMGIGMRDLSGSEVCRAIRGSDQDRDNPLPIIAYTAHAMVEECKEYLAAGFDDTLTKPTMREDLFGMLRKYIG